jgi:hypothetical protein
MRKGKVRVILSISFHSLDYDGAIIAPELLRPEGRVTRVSSKVLEILTVYGRRESINLRSGWSVPHWLIPSRFHQHSHLQTHSNKAVIEQSMFVI